MQIHRHVKALHHTRGEYAHITQSESLSPVLNLDIEVDAGVQV